MKSVPLGLLTAGVLLSTAQAVTLQELKFPTFRQVEKGSDVKVSLPLPDLRPLPASLVSLQDPAQFCVATPYETMGQGWATDFSTGGITFKAATYGAQNPDFKTIFRLDPTAMPRESRSVTVIVVDRFDPIPVEMDEPGMTPYTVNLRHGELVTAHLIALLRSAHWEPDHAAKMQSIVMRNPASPARLTIRKLALPERSPNSPPTPVEVVVDLLNRLKFTEPTVMNMSFSVMPCEAMAHYRSLRDQFKALGGRYNFSQFIQDVVNNNAAVLAGVATPVKEVEKLMTTLPNTNLLRLWLDANAPKNTLVVAASGNYGMQFTQTWPAAAPTAIGVGIAVPTVTSAKRADLSDMADVFTVGEWFKFSKENLFATCHQTSTCFIDDELLEPNKYLDFGYRGTSFTSPNVVAFLALRRMENAAGCFMTTGSGFKKINGKLGGNFFTKAFGIHTPCP